jgi:hypothetical protein
MGNIELLDSLQITWPRGNKQTLKMVSANQFLTIEEDFYGIIIDSVIPAPKSAEIAVPFDNLFKVYAHHTNNNPLSYKWTLNGTLTSQTASYLIKPGLLISGENVLSCKIEDLINHEIITVDWLVNPLITSSGNDTQTKNLYVIYPNPVDDILFIKGYQNDSFKAELYTSAGNKVIEKVVTEGFIDISQLVPGYYILKIDNISFRVLIK